MPPRKKVRQPSRATSTPPGEDAVEQAEKETPAPTKADLDLESAISDVWTEEQEISLFKSMLRWKPGRSYLKKNISPQLRGGQH